MGGARINYQSSAHRGKTPQAKKSWWYNWRGPIFATLAVVCVTVAVVRHIALACPSTGCSVTVVPLTEPQKLAADIVSPLTEPQKSAADIVRPMPEAQTSAADVALPLPEPQESSTDIVRLLPKPQKSGRSVSAPRLVLPVGVATKVGYKIWLNETGGNREAITSWNANEEFASLGIGHFIWFPAGKRASFEESFPRLLEFLRTKNVRLPAWIDKTPIPPCPWVSKTDFTRNFNSAEMKELRQFLSDTVAEQTQFLVRRANDALDKIIESTPESADREHIISQFSRVAGASKDLYPLIDYINFKGEGTNPSETTLDKEAGIRQGWGLKQVLLQMTGTTSDPVAVLAEFADAAQLVLKQRIRNMPAGRIWEAGWSRRVDTYRHPLPDQFEYETKPKQTKRRVTDLSK
jgi:hypothetical protein